MKQFQKTQYQIIFATLILISGCSSMPPMASKEQDETSKKFVSPAASQSGIYIYRDSDYGSAVRKKAQVSVDDSEIGYTIKYTFFHKTVSPGMHTVSTGDSAIEFNAVAGKNYYFHQYIKLGAFTGKPSVETVSEEVGKRGVLECSEIVGLADKVATPEATNTADTNQKLRELQALKKDGLISEEEFNQKRKQLLEKL